VVRYKVAEQIYHSIRECDTDICDIAANLGFKADNIMSMEHKKFDPSRIHPMTFMTFNGSSMNGQNVTMN
jgi:hypothetical protein